MHLFQAAEKARLDDESAWRAANPGIAVGIKSIGLVHARRGAACRNHDDRSKRPSERSIMNRPAVPSTELLVGLDDYLDCEVDELPPRSGPGFLGVDLGGSSSLTAAVCYWPETMRCETWAAFPGTPSLAERGSADGVGALYERAFEKGELMTFPGRITPAGDFLGAILDALEGADVQSVGADRFRRAEADGRLRGPRVFPWRRVVARHSGRVLDGGWKLRL